MIKTSIEKLSSEIGFDIGMSDDITQSNLLNGFCRALRNSMDDRSLDMQVASMVDKLTPESIKVLSKIYAFIELKVKQ